MKPYTSRRKLILIIFSIFSMVTFISCQKDILPIFKKIDFNSGKPLVFVAGAESNGVNNVAKIWIDGQELTLSDGTNNAVANSIFVNGDDTHIAGNDAGPVYWKNNTEINLPVKSITANAKLNSNANSIYVSGNKVFIAGNDSTSAVYWKDGTEIILNSTNAKGNFGYSSGNSVFISGNDIYVAGYDGPNAVYWKNGIEVYLTDNTTAMYGHATATSISVSAGNVYVVGAAFMVGGITQMPKYWKNEIDETLTLNNSNFEFYSTNSVFALGNNIYISGIEYQRFPFLTNAIFWNNGNETTLSNDGINFYNTSSIYVKGNDVYISGNEEINDSQLYAVYWKNGTEVKLTDGTRNAFANSVFAK
jgi:hypothetical protein